MLAELRHDQQQLPFISSSDLVNELTLKDDFGLTDGAAFAHDARLARPERDALKDCFVDACDQMSCGSSNVPRS